MVVRDVSPLRLQLLGQGSSEVVDYVGRSDDRTFARQGTNVCGAHAACAAGYDRYLAVDMTGVAYGYSFRWPATAPAASSVRRRDGAGPWFSYRLSTAQALTPGAP